MKINYTKIFTFTLCILFIFSAVSFADSNEEKLRAKAEDENAYVKSTHNYTPRFLNIDKASLALEDFESGTYPPTGWTEYHTGLDELNESTVQSWSPTHASLFNDVTGVDTSWFITPQILALDAGSQLSFYQYQNFGTWVVYHGILVSTASGDPTVGDFVEVQSLTAGVEDDWEFITVDLSAYDGQDIYVAFVYSGSNADEWYLDDIAVAPPAAYDIGVASVYTETSDLLIPGANVTVNAIVQNFGADDATGFNVDLSGDDGHTETYLFSGTLVAGTTDTVTFTNPWVPASGGTFELTSFTEWGDADPSNDTSSVTMDIIGIEPLDFEENFEDYTTVPNSIGWLGSTNTDFGTFVPSTTDDGLWRSRDFGNDPTLTNSARVNLYGSSDGGGWLITPPIDMTTGQSNNTLFFDAAITPWTGTDSTGLNTEDTIYVVISTDGLTWDRSNIIASFDSTSVVMPAGTHYEIDLSAWDNETALHIGFLAIDNAGPNDKLFYFDNLMVGQPPVTAPFLEDFETGIIGAPGTLPAGWTNEIDDDWNWYVDAGGTGSSGTGPTVDHTTNSDTGIYIYTEATSHENQAFNVTSPYFDVSGLTAPALTFWYHMAGTAVGELHVDVYDGTTWYLDVRAPYVGAQQAQADPWIMSAADLSGYGNIIKVRFRAVTGTWSSDIAIDDVSINEIALIPNDIVASGFDMPYLTMIPLSQSTLLSGIDVAGTFSNSGPANTGDINLAIYDSTGVMVHSDMITGATISSFSASMFSFMVDASGTDAGAYDVALFSSNFVDTVAANDTSWYSQTFGDQMAYDLGNWDYNVAYSATNVRNRMGVRYTLADADTLKNVTIAVGSATGTDSFAVDLFTSDADTPSVLISRIYRGIFDSVGVSHTVVFDAPNIPLAAGDYWVVYDIDNQATSTYGLGADAQAQGAVAVERRFGWQIPGLAWDYWENAGNPIFGTLTPIIRMGLSGEAPEPPPDPSILYADDFEAYTAGVQLTSQNSVDWQTWSGTPGTAEDPFISNTYANSGVNSFNLITNNDLVKVMPNYTTGAYKVSFDMYIPTGTVAYFNTLQEFIPTPQWGMQVQFNAGGVGDIDGGVPTATTFSFSYDTWLHNEVIVNLEKDTAEYYLDGVRIHGWKWTEGTGVNGTIGPLQLGGSNFFGGGPVGTFDYYVDDYELKEVSSAIFADNFDSYTAGTALTVQSMDWTTWTGTPGTAEDPMVSNAYSNSGANSVVIAPDNDVVHLFGSITSGVYSASFMTYVPSGQSGYFNTMAGFAPNPNSWTMDCYFNVGGGGEVYGGSATSVPFTFTHDSWFSVEVVVDLDQDLAELLIDGVAVHQWQWTLGNTGNGSPLQLDVIDFFGGTSTDEMYIDDFVFDTADALVNGIDDLNNALPTVFALKQNYPNPFNPTTTIKYQLPKKADIKIVIYNMLGQVVRTIVNKSVDAGYHEVVWDGLNETGSRVATGVYFYRMKSEKFVKTHKMILMK
jgi:MAM domain-containing protein meprin/A5/mu/flagellar hook capping protein FlgD